MGSRAPTIISILAVLLVSATAAPTTEDLPFFSYVMYQSPQPSTTYDSPFHSSVDKFTRNMFPELLQSKGDRSIIYSPFSIQTCLAMVRMGATGETATEMDKGLAFSGQSPESLADNYHTMLAKYEKSNILEIANKAYIPQGYQLQDKFNDVLTKKFLSPAENIDFGQSESAAATINAWVESKTNNTIKDLVKADSLSSDTLLYLVSAIHFKGDWEEPFDPKDTKEEDFYIDENNSVKVEMMHRKADGIAVLDGVDATVVNLPYKNSDLSMMIILPRSRTGLAELEKKLRNVTLKRLLAEVISGKLVDLKLPKFKAEFEIELTETLMKMGMNKMFAADTDFSSMLKSPEPFNIASVAHKAFIEVNEVGTEAAAATAVVGVARGDGLEFIADHPFYYVILDGDAVPLFQGTFIGV